MQFHSMRSIPHFCRPALCNVMLPCFTLYHALHHTLHFRYTVTVPAQFRLPPADVSITATARHILVSAVILLRVLMLCARRLIKVGALTHQCSLTAMASGGCCSKTMEMLWASPHTST